MDGIQRRLGFKSSFVAECVGKSGGLCLMWDEDIEVSVKSYTAHHIDVVVAMSCQWRLSCVYGWPNGNDKRHTLGLLKYLWEDPHEAWFWMGDFNRLYNLEDKKGGVPVGVVDVLEFHETVEECSMRELTMEGNYFTWDNRRDGQDLIQERIDLAFMNEKWAELYPGVRVLHLARCGSDHIPIKISLNPEDVTDPGSVPRPI
ncbi:LOW QUALITY PROTEIN: hypothetical protein V2J09_004395 [Rumex salicifolius]